MKQVLEVCVDSYDSARAAVAGGATRLELCAALSVGGLTPYAELLSDIRSFSDIPARCLMRPRAGDFLYTRQEISMMARQMQVLRENGASGFVIGCLTPEGELAPMEELMEAAGGLPLTLHRCIDVSRDPEKTYCQAAELGFDTVLTSGAAANATGTTIRTHNSEFKPASPASRNITKSAVEHPTGTLFKATIQFPVMRRVRGIAQRTAGITSQTRMLTTFPTMFFLRFSFRNAMPRCSLQYPRFCGLQIRESLAMSMQECYLTPQCPNFVTREKRSIWERVPQ